MHLSTRFAYYAFIMLLALQNCSMPLACGAANIQVEALKDKKLNISIHIFPYTCITNSENGRFLL